MYEKKARIANYQYSALVLFSAMSKSTFCRKFSISSTRLNKCISGEETMLEKELLDIAEKLDGVIPFFSKDGSLKGFLGTNGHCYRGGNNKKRGQQLKMSLGDGFGVCKTHIPAIPENKAALAALNGPRDWLGHLLGTNEQGKEK